MIDLRRTIAPKSDQLNADDLIAGPLTIRITSVAVGDGDQPVSISFDGDGGKPYKPGKSMRRVLVALWGPDGETYVGRSLTLYRDEKVQFGGEAVGGIRISHMSNLDREMTLALTATRAKRKPFTVKPLVVTDKAADGTRDLVARINAAEAPEDKVAIVAAASKQIAWLRANRPELAKQVDDALPADPFTESQEAA